MIKTEHHPLPWISKAAGKQYIEVRSEKGGHGTIFSVDLSNDKEIAEELKADIALIIKAVNCHADLLAALEEAREELLAWQDVIPQMREGRDGLALQKTIQIIDAAIAKAKGAA